MLDLPRYLLGVAEIALLAGSAALGASAARARLLPAFSGAPAHLATAVLALALLVWVAELLGSFGLFEPLAYVAAVVAVGLATRLLLPAGPVAGVEGAWGCPSRLLGFSPAERAAPRGRGGGEKQDAAAPEGHPHTPVRPPGQSARGGRVATAIGLAIATVAVVKFGLEAKPELTTGMTGFDSTWYHGPFAAGFAQSGDTWGLHRIAPQFLTWFYPANAEIFHAAGMLTFDRDVLSPLLNLGWFAGCLIAVWCIGRPYGLAPLSLALGAVALSVPVFADQAGEARNDIVGTFFLLAAVAVAVNAWVSRADDRGLPTGALLVAGLAAGLAAGTKLNFLPPAAALLLGLALIAPAGRRRRALAATCLAAFAGGGYWYLRNLIHTGNPVPWFDRIGPIPLPAPDQPLGGRQGHSVLGYLTDGSVWSGWLIPGFAAGLTVLWPLFLAVALGGLLLCLGRRVDAPLRVAAAVGLAVLLAWLIAPTSASGPEGMPRGFESGLRYLVPALVLGLALLPATPPLRRLTARLNLPTHGAGNDRLARPIVPAGGRLALGALVIAAVALGYPVQRHYLEDRYADPSFATPGLNAAFRWARSVSGARVATTGTRQYPLLGTDLSNRVRFVGIARPRGGFVAPATCRAWRRALDAGDYDYVIATRDRIEPGKPPYPPTARWTEGSGATVVLRKPPTVVFRLTGPLDPSACP